ncbi:MAG: hypothetical protein HY077_02420 [Elusimicrobia bacterium]|nr:hypothetical protein [Elusimicrobiota bacterium]
MTARALLSISLLALAAPTAAWAIDDPISVTELLNHYYGRNRYIPPAQVAPAQASPVEPEDGPPARERWGLIVNGDVEASSPTHIANTEKVLAFMKNYYRIPEGHVVMLSVHKTTVTKDLIVKEAARLKDAKMLVLYTTGHGDDRDDQSELILPEKPWITADEFARLFLVGKAASIVYLGDQCYSGGFASAMIRSLKRMKDPEGKRRAVDMIAISATDFCHVTYCQNFLLPYLDAFKDPANDNDPKDGRVSEWEAFKAARDKYAKAFSPEDGGVPQYLTAHGRP